MDDRLLIEATPALLDGWCGPVVVEVPRPVVGSGLSFDVEKVEAVWDDVGLCEFPEGYTSACAIYLDLSRAECRDRVARVVEAVATSPGSGVTARALARGRTMALSTLAILGCDLDPKDDTRLPDGSRLVDALALAAAWRAQKSTPAAQP